jgi:gamma-tubulin complex component 4
VLAEFTRQSGFLFTYLSNMSSPQTSPHLAQLLLRLNFNNYFV